MNENQLPKATGGTFSDLPDFLETTADGLQEYLSLSDVQIVMLRRRAVKGCGER